MTPVSNRPSIVKKTSKLSFSMKREKGRDRDQSAEKDRGEAPGRPSVGTTLTTTPSSGSSSFFNVSSNHTVVPEPNANGAATPSMELDVNQPPRSQSPSASTKSKILPPIPRDFGTSPIPRSPSPMPTGEVDREVFESMGNNTLSVRFEINIVKVRCSPGFGDISRLYVLARFHGCRSMAFNSGGPAGTVGNIKCWPDGF